jgi:hypothetical protein
MCPSIYPLVSQIISSSEDNCSAPGPVYHSSQQLLPPTIHHLGAATLQGYLLSQSSALLGWQPGTYKVHELGEVSILSYSESEELTEMQDWSPFSVELSHIRNALASLSRSSTTSILTTTVVAHRTGISGSAACTPFRSIAFIRPGSKLH